MQEIYPIPQEQRDNPELLIRQLAHFARLYKAASVRKERLQDLMRRKSVQNWAPEKTQKMVRRLMATTKEIEQAENALDQLRHRLSQMGIEVDVVSRKDIVA